MSSRRTSAQIIASGDYLQPDFDPASLTVSQLLGVLGYHNVTYPTPYSKSKLVHVFNLEIKEKAAELSQEQLKKTNSIASEDGITDGLTGEPIAKAPPRRLSRRLSKVPPTTTDQETSPVRPEQGKRRRASAQPTPGRTTTRRKKAIEADIIHESDSETEERPVKKVGRTRKTADASTQARQVSHADDSGWEDNNIFQSGAEDSSPVRPSPMRTKFTRRTAGGRKSRKSFSAPPQPSPPSSPTRPQAYSRSPFSPPETEFRPNLPFVPVHDFHLPSPPPPELSPTMLEHVNQEVVEDVAQEVGEDASQEVEDDVKEDEEPNAELVDDHSQQVEEVEDSQQAIAVSNRVLKSMEAAKRFPTPLVPAEKPSWFLRLLFAALFSIATYYAHDYKGQSAAIGYCDTGSNTNCIVQELKTRHELARQCNLENRTTLYPSGDHQDLTPCPLPPLLPIPQPESCTPCPDHASCSQFSVTCEPGYILHPSPLLFFMPTPPQSSNSSFATASSPSEFIWGALHDCLNGLPGFGSVALPPRCLEDPKRKLHIGALGRAIEITLGRERGRRLCTGAHQPSKETDGGEAKEWGVELTTLKEVMRKKTPVNRLPVFDDIFNEAIQELIQWGGITIGEDSEGHRYLAHKAPELTWSCTAIVKTRDVWAEWKPTVFVALTILIAAAFGRRRMARLKTESRRTGELVQIALDTLRNQEIAHHTDPVTAPHPYLSSLQLRDLILQDEHSIPTRRRLWDQVEKVVEGNANVRTNMEEVEGGDELRVWRWVGSNRGRRIEGGADDSVLSLSPRTFVEES